MSDSKKYKIMIACSIFEKELQACLPVDGSPEIIWIDAGLHADLPRLEVKLTKKLEECQADEAGAQVFLGSGCHPEINRLVMRFGTGIAPVKNCMEAFCGESVKELEENRTMIMTPGWIRAGLVSWKRWDGMKLMSELTLEDMTEYFFLIRE